MSYFSKFKRFLETGNASARLDARNEIIIGRNLDHIFGKTILDLGAHDGRWAFAALDAGAKHVTLIEGRSDLLDRAKANFDAYGIDPSRYTLVQGEGLASMRELPGPFDTVFLLGIYYHIHNHIDWVSEIRRLGAQIVIIDTGLTPCDGEFDNVVRFKIEDVDLINSSQFETFEGYGKAFAGHPSRAFVRSSFRVFGYDVSEADWSKMVEKYGTKPLHDYATDGRATFVAKRAR